MYKPNTRYTVILHLICGGYAAGNGMQRQNTRCYHTEFVGDIQHKLIIKTMINFKDNQESNFSKAGQCFLDALKHLIAGVKEVAVSTYNRTPKSVIITMCFIIILAVCVGWLVSYVHMKTQLTTAEWQRDSLILKVDSIQELHGKTVEYSRMQN